MENSNILDLLMQAEIPAAPEKQLKQKRLSKACKGDVIFTIRTLSYSKVAEIKGSHDEDDMPVLIMLAGVKSPNLKSSGLMEKFGAITPAELIKKMLLPGEIEEISRKIEELSGYRVSTFEEVKKK